MEKETKTQFNKVWKEFGKVHVEFGKVRKEFSQRFDKVEAEIESLAIDTQRQFAEQDKKMDQGFSLLDGKIDHLITTVDGIAKNFKDHTLEITALTHRQDRLDRRVDRLEASA